MLERFVMAELAEAELTEAVAFYDEEAPGKGLELAREVYSAIQHAMVFPGSGSPIDDDRLAIEVRRYLLNPAFPYHVVAAVIDEEYLFVFAVAHQSRDPSYWVERLDEPEP